MSEMYPERGLNTPHACQWTTVGMFLKGAAHGLHSGYREVEQCTVISCLQVRTRPLMRTVVDNLGVFRHGNLKSYSACPCKPCIGFRKVWLR